jgi:hypothetical protein
MNKLLLNSMLIFSSILIFQGCSEDEETPTGPDEVTAPDSYQFGSRFDGDGVSSVSYSGQTVRNVLIGDIKSTIANTGSGTATTAEALVALYTNSSETATLLNDATIAYQDISDKNLSGKIATDMGDVIGYGMLPDDLIRSWFDAVEAGNYDQTSTGIHIDQMVGKGLLGMVSYYQATSVYFDKVNDSTEDNSVASDGTDPYTDMEHHFDEAFGYYGAAIGYKNMTESERQSSGSATTAAEYTTLVNFDWAKYASKRSNVTGCSQSTGLDDSIMDAFLLGRAHISAESPLSDIQEQMDNVMTGWETVVAANVIHYAREVHELMVSGDATFNCQTHAPDTGNSCGKLWSEMAPFAMALQFNENSPLTTDDLTELQSVIGDAPPTTNTAADQATFENIIAWLIDKYSLDADCSAW